MYQQPLENSIEMNNFYKLTNHHHYNWESECNQQQFLFNGNCKENSWRLCHWSVLKPESSMRKKKTSETCPVQPLINCNISIKTFNSFTNVKRLILTIMTMNVQIKTLYQLQTCDISCSYPLNIIFFRWPECPSSILIGYWS